MTFQQLISKAIEVRKLFSKVEKNKYGKTWSPQDLMSGFVGDVGDLSKVIQAKSGVRDIPNVDEKLKHELSDCLWSIITIADAYGIDLEKAFVENMDQLTEKLEE